MSGQGLGRVSSYVIDLEQVPEVMCSGSSQTTHDFSGQRIASLGNWNRFMNWTTFSLVATGDGSGAAAFVWLDDPDALNERMIRTLDQLSDAELPHALVRFAFEFFENTFFSPEWWDSLDPSSQDVLRTRIMNGLPPQPEHTARCLADDGVRVVNWKVVERSLSLGSDARAFVLGG